MYSHLPTYESAVYANNYIFKLYFIYNIIDVCTHTYLCFVIISKPDLVFLVKTLVVSNSADVSCNLLSTPSNL